MTEASRRQMLQFVEAISPLADYRFMQTLLHENMSVKLNAPRIGERATLEVKQPTKESADAVALTGRLLNQDNDGLSLRNISKLCDDPGISQEWKDHFTVLRRLVNDHLDDRDFIMIDEERLTNREVFDTILYGYFAHFTPAKVARVKVWRQNPLVWSLRLMDFYQALFQLVAAALNIVEVSKLELAGEPIPPAPTIEEVYSERDAQEQF